MSATVDLPGNSQNGFDDTVWEEDRILATKGFEQTELAVPKDRLSKAGATVEVISLASGEIKGWDKKDWRRTVKVDKTLDEAVRRSPCFERELGRPGM